MSTDGFNDPHDWDYPEIKGTGTREMSANSLRVPTRHDPLTLAEIADLERQLRKMLDEKLPSYHLLRCQLDNVSRLHATIAFYHELFKGTRDLISLDAALPKRVVRNGIAYLEDQRP